MDTDAFHSALVSLTLLPEELHSARENLATVRSEDHIALTDFMSKIERDLRFAKAALATELGFTLCQCCWPPELMVISSEGMLTCAGELRSKDCGHFDVECSAQSERTGVTSITSADPAPTFPERPRFSLS